MNNILHGAGPRSSNSSQLPLESWLMVAITAILVPLTIDLFPVCPYYSPLPNLPHYSASSVIDTQTGAFPNAYVSRRVNFPESGLTLNDAMRPDSWPAE